MIFVDANAATLIEQIVLKYIELLWNSRGISVHAFEFS